MGYPPAWAWSNSRTNAFSRRGPQDEKRCYEATVYKDTRKLPFAHSPTELGKEHLLVSSRQHLDSTQSIHKGERTSNGKRESLSSFSGKQACTNLLQVQNRLLMLYHLVITGASSKTCTDHSALSNESSKFQANHLGLIRMNRFTQTE